MAGIAASAYFYELSIAAHLANVHILIVWDVDIVKANCKNLIKFYKKGKE